MSRPVVVRPHAYRQFAAPAPTFCLVTDPGLVNEVVVDGGPAYVKTITVPLGPGGSLTDLLSGAVPEPADVLVICRESLITSPDPQVMGAGRRLVVMPCASTPVTVAQVRYFLEVMERTDPGAQAQRAEAFFDAIEAAGTVMLVDGEQGSRAELNPFGDGVSGDAGGSVWHQQAGFLGPGEQQIAPAGELSVFPMEITEFDPTRRLALNGTLTLHGWPIVHAGYYKAGYDNTGYDNTGCDNTGYATLAAEQAALFQRLVPLARTPVVLSVDHGRITGCRPGVGRPGVGTGVATADPDALVAVLEELFAAEPAYRTIWELGFGINTAMTTVSANCGLNEPYGSHNGVVHLGLGLTPFTRFAVTFLCPATAVVDHHDRTLLGPYPRRS